MNIKAHQEGAYNINSCHSARLGYLNSKRLKLTAWIGKPNMYIQLYWQNQTGDEMENTPSGEIR